MRALWILVLALPIGWFGWHYLEFRACGRRSCAAPADEPPIRVESGKEIVVLDTRRPGMSEVAIDYLTEHGRNDLGALCDEAREVWKSVSGSLESRRIERAVLGPTNPDSEFLGMKYLVVPLYTCCVTTHLRAEKSASGEWVFPQCPS